MYLGYSESHSVQKLLSQDTDTHTGPITLPGPLKWPSMNWWEFR